MLNEGRTASTSWKKTKKKMVDTDKTESNQISSHPELVRRILFIIDVVNLVRFVFVVSRDYDGAQ